MRYIVTATLLIAGLIHLLPTVGVFGSERLASLYGISIAEPNSEILMRHRAVLFGLLGGVLVLAAFKPALQPLAFVLGLISAASFLYLAWTVGGYNALLSRVVSADILALVCLIIGAAANAYTREG